MYGLVSLTTCTRVAITMVNFLLSKKSLENNINHYLLLMWNPGVLLRGDLRNVKWEILVDSNKRFISNLNPLLIPSKKTPASREKFRTPAIFPTL
jgi:hypothetical protein